MKKRLFTIALFSCLLNTAQAVCTQELRTWTPYNDFYEMQEKFDSIAAPQREHLSFRFRLVPQTSELTLDQTRLYILRKQERIEIPIDNDGVMRFPRNEQYHAEKLQIYTCLNKNQRVGIKAEVLVNLPGSPSYRYSELIRWMMLASDATRSRAGVWSLFMPKPTGLDIKLPPAGYATLLYSNGTAERLDMREDGYIQIPFDNRRQLADPNISFSSKPLEALPHYEKNMTLFAEGDR